MGSPAAAWLQLDFKHREHGTKRATGLGMTSCPRFPRYEPIRSQGLLGDYLSEIEIDTTAGWVYQGIDAGGRKVRTRS